MGKDVDVGLPQPLEIDMGLDNINMSSSMFMNMSPISIDMGLDNVNMDMNMDTNISFNGSVDMGLDNVNVDMGLDNVNVDMGLDNVNMCMSFAIKELPSMKMHFPLNMDFGIKVLGIPLLNFGICGKAMVVTEDNPKKIFYTPRRGNHQGVPRPQGSLPAAETDSGIRVTLSEQ